MRENVKHVGPTLHAVEKGASEEGHGHRRSDAVVTLQSGLEAPGVNEDSVDVEKKRADHSVDSSKAPGDLAVASDWPMAHPHQGGVNLSGRFRRAGWEPAGSGSSPRICRRWRCCPVRGKNRTARRALEWLFAWRRRANRQA